MTAFTLRSVRLLPIVLAMAIALGLGAGCDKDDGAGPAQTNDTAVGQDTGTAGDGATSGDAGTTGDSASTGDSGTTDDGAAMGDTLTTGDTATSDDTGGADDAASLDTKTGGLTTAQSALTRDLTPDVPTADQEAVVAGNTAFAVDLYHWMGKEPGNLFLSPVSVSTALAMTYAGAKGSTAAQMAATMHFDLPQDKLHPAFNWLDLELNSRGEGAEGADGEEFRLHVVNALWGQQDYGFLDSFLDALAVNYGAGMTLVDFLQDAEAARLVINAWVAEQTEGRIPELIPAGLLTPATRLVLTNAVYFNAAWKSKFDADNTVDAPFHRLDGTDVTAPLMQQTEVVPYVEGADYVAIELPYDGEELSMVIVAPNEGSFDTFEQGLTAQGLSDIVGSLVGEDLWISMPRFEVETSAKLGQALKDLGMSDAFVYGVSDFSGMDGTHELFISEVIHKTFVKVNEAGTEAAAATAVIMEGGGVPTQVRIDRPFLFFIRDVQTGTILFMGRIVDPTA